MTTTVINTLPNVTIVDLMCDARMYQPSIYSADGFHPNDSGYAIIADEIVKAVTLSSYPAPKSSCAQMTFVLQSCLLLVSGVYYSVEVLPEWYEDVTARRQDVWVATGMVMGREHQPGGDALSVLRGYAYSNERTLDDVADDLVHGRLKVRDLGVG